MADSILGSVYSRADALKRQLYDMLTNPRDYASMMAGRTQEAAQAAQALQNMAFANPERPTQITDPKALQQLTNMIMAGPMGFAPAGITAYHGSPYLFRMFDPAKVGAGEGAQAYGVGAGYTAEARPVAEGYARRIIKREDSDNYAINNVANRLYKGGFDDEYIKNRLKTVFPEIKDDQINASIKIAKSPEAAGYLYKGDIPDEILPKFLDWDKPLSQQTKEVQDAIGKDLIESVAKEVGVPADKLTGGQFYTRNYRADTNLMPKGIDKSAEQMESDWLQSRGIAGIRYLDQGSRGEGKGTSNFIPFRAEDYKIQEINDIPVEDYIRQGLL